MTAPVNPAWPHIAAALLATPSAFFTVAERSAAIVNLYDACLVQRYAIGLLYMQAVRMRASHAEDPHMAARLDGLLAELKFQFEADAKPAPRESRIVRLARAE
jgi:hypothetical protein